MSINHVTLSGNITKQPELKRGNSGSILPFSIAVNRRTKDANGEWIDQASFFDCVIFGTRAEKIAQYLNKGTKVCISGRLSQKKWQTHEGENRYSTNVVVEDIEFMSRGYAQAAQTTSVLSAEPQEEQVDEAVQTEMYGDLPF